MIEKAINLDIQCSQIMDNMASVQSRIERAARISGRKPDEIKVVVVSKGQPIEVVNEAIKAGVVLFGENYPQEAVAKITQTPAGIEWHMIGHLQTRKIPQLIQHFHYFHSLDSLNLADRLNKCLKGKTFSVLLEVNIGNERNKNGWIASNTEEWSSLIPDIMKITLLEGLRVSGLMAMPPFSFLPEQSRVFFQRMRLLKEFLSKEIPQINWVELSMGTSTDFEVAIEEGATFIRLGHAILGSRLSQ